MTLWPGFVVAATSPTPSTLPVVTNVAGAVSVRGQDGVSRDVISSRIIRSGDTLMTGADSLAVINLADIGSIRVGPTSAATASATVDHLTLDIRSGSACAQAVSRGISMRVGLLTLAAAGGAAIFSLIRDQSGTTVAVYQGSVAATLSGNAASKPTTLKQGEAAIASQNALPHRVPIESVQPSFAALKCPGEDVIARVVPSPVPSQAASGGHGGGGGGIIGILLGLGALAALAGGHGGGGGGGSAPTAPPTRPPGALGVNPLTLTFVPGDGSKTFTASESNYHGPINAASNDTSVATVSPNSGNGPSVQFTVTPVGAGTTTISVTDNHGGSQAVSVTVFGPITASPMNFQFTDVGAGAARPLSVSEVGYTGNFTIDASSCAGIAGVNPTSSTGSFLVTPAAEGGPCSLSITDGHGSPAIQVGVNVGPFGAVSPSVGAVSLTTGGLSSNFTVSESGYTGSFTLDASSCTTNGFASASPSSGTSSTTFTITSEGLAGNCKVIVSDDHGGSSAINVFITAGTLTVSPPTLQFADTSSASQDFTANDVGAFVFQASSSDTTVATVTPLTQFGANQATFTVSPGTSLGRATITVTDNLGGTAVVSVGVGQSPLLKRHRPAIHHRPLASPAPKATPPHVIARPIGESPVPAASNGLAISPARPPMPARTPAASPSPSFGPMSVSANNMMLVSTGSAQSVVVSEPGYMRLFTLVNSNVGAAAVSFQSANGPVARLAILPRSPGSTTIRILDDHGGVQTIQVIVRAQMNVRDRGRQ